MTSGEIMSIFNEGMLVLVRIAGPILVASILIGLIVAVFQAATQIHEQTLTFVPKLIVIGLVLLLGGQWMMTSLVDFFHMLLERIATL